jgi:hypothetical protein
MTTNSYQYYKYIYQHVYVYSTACVSTPGCAFCTGSNACFSDTNVTADRACTSTLCAGLNCAYVCKKPCSDKDNLYPCSENIVGQLLLMLFYGVILMCGAKLISDGSELMLELFPAFGTVIGALLLPILGAVPDAAIILVSGLGDPAQAQAQVAVGVGTLAGKHYYCIITKYYYCCFSLFFYFLYIVFVLFFGLLFSLY